MQKFSDNILVVLNKFTTDQKEEIDIIAKRCGDLKVEFAISEAYEKGSSGCLEVAQKVINLTARPIKIKSLPYDLEDSLLTKIKKVCCNYLNAKDVLIKDDIKDKFKMIEKSFPNLPICIAKTQYSISDDKKLLGNPHNFIMRVTDIEVASGAGFIIVSMGSIMRMPGLSKNANYLNMDINDGIIEGLF